MTSTSGRANSGAMVAAGSSFRTALMRASSPRRPAQAGERPGEGVGRDVHVGFYRGAAEREAQARAVLLGQAHRGEHVGEAPVARVARRASGDEAVGLLERVQ